MLAAASLELPLRLTLVGVGALAVTVMLRLISRHWGRPLSVFDIHPKQKGRRVAGPAALESLETAIVLGLANGLDFDQRLCPLLYELANARLRTHRHLDMKRDAGAAALLIGQENWEVLTTRAHRSRRDPGLSKERLDAIIAALEGL